MSSEKISCGDKAAFDPSLIFKPSDYLKPTEMMNSLPVQKTTTSTCRGFNDSAISNDIIDGAETHQVEMDQEELNSSFYN